MFPELKATVMAFVPECVPRALRYLLKNVCCRFMSEGFDRAAVSLCSPN